MEARLKLAATHVYHIRNRDENDEASFSDPLLQQALVVFHCALVTSMLEARKAPEHYRR